MRKLFTTILALLSIPGMVLAECGGSVCAPSHVVNSTPYVTPIETPAILPVAVPVVVPATVFQYLPALAPAAPAVGAASPAVPTTAAPTVGTPVAPTVGMPAAPAAAGVQVTQTNQDDLDAKIDALVRRRLDQILREKATGISQDAPAELVDLDAAQTQQKQPNDKLAAPAGDLTTRAMAVVSNNCMACHGGKEARGGVSLVNAQNQWQPVHDGEALTNADIAASVASHRMPKLSAKLGNKPMSQQETADLLTFLQKK